VAGAGDEAVDLDQREFDAVQRGDLAALRLLWLMRWPASPSPGSGLFKAG
jgi:hypothetical protein